MKKSLNLKWKGMNFVNLLKKYLGLKLASF